MMLNSTLCMTSGYNTGTDKKANVRSCATTNSDRCTFVSETVMAKETFSGLGLNPVDKNEIYRQLEMLRSSCSSLSIPVLRRLLRQF